MKLKGKTAVVTGGAMGIGLATAKRLLKAGASVAVWDIDRKALQAAIKELKTIGDGRVFGQICDVTDGKAVARSAKQAVKDMGRVDILVNNAGYVAGGDFLDLPFDKWKKTIDVNLTCLHHVIRAFLPGMYARNSGAVVNVSSAAGTIGVPGLAAYSAAKAGVWMLTESLRHEARNRQRRGIHFASVHPSFIAAGMFAGAKIRGLGGLLVPLIKDHDTVARCIVNAALKRNRRAPKRPRTVRLAVLLRGVLPDAWFQAVARFLSIHKSMRDWHGR